MPEFDSLAVRQEALESTCEYDEGTNYMKSRE